MKQRVCLVLGLSLALGLGGCMTTEQGLQFQREQLDLKRRLVDVERYVKSVESDQAGGMRSRLETLARNQADFQATLDGLRVDVQGMQGRYADLDRVRDELRQELTLLKDELSLQLADLEKRQAELERRSLAAPAAVPAASAAPSVPVSPTAPAVAATPVAESAGMLYERALATIRDQHDFAAGRELMATFLKRYPADPLAVNAAYWVGETYYAEKAYDKAILQFEEVILQYGDHPKVASALLKQALAFDAIGDRANAKLLLQRVVERFPLAEEAGKAKEKLKEWGG